MFWVVFGHCKCKCKLGDLEAKTYAYPYCTVDMVDEQVDKRLALHVDVVTMARADVVADETVDSLRTIAVDSLDKCAIGFAD